MCIMIYYEETMKEGHKIMEDFETKITVRYAETDQMGVAHHSVPFIKVFILRPCM